MYLADSIGMKLFDYLKDRLNDDESRAAELTIGFMERIEAEGIQLTIPFDERRTETEDKGV